jgi:hypothetical protein
VSFPRGTCILRQPRLFIPQAGSLAPISGALEGNLNSIYIVAVPNTYSGAAPPLATQSAPAWRDHVKGVYASLKAVDPSTSYKEAMTHAKASWKK